MNRTLPWLVVLWILVISGFGGCSLRRENSALTLAKAQALAVQLANDQAMELFEIQPFQTHDAEIERTDEGWKWQALVGRGKADLVASVSFRPDGSEPRVCVEMHTSEVIREFYRQVPLKPAMPAAEPRPIPERMPQEK